jgi:murein L,D-transpeptidase YcbB/YkuD
VTPTARLAVRGGLIVAALLAVAGIFYGRQVSLANGQVSRRIRADLAARKMPADAPWRDRRTQALLRAFYGRRKMQPAWSAGAAPNAQAKDLAEVLAHADAEGLRPEDYSTAELTAQLEKHRRTPLEKMKPSALAGFDLLCSIAAFHYMSDVHDGRISPRALDAVWVAQPRKGDLNATLQSALEKRKVAEMLRGLPPEHPEYERLREARARYAKLAGDGGWRSIPPGPPLAKGQRGMRVRALRARLAVTGELPRGAASSDVFDGGLMRAVERFETRAGRDADGIVDAAELAELNVSAVQRLRQIDLNMERWRWLPRSFGPRHLLVNIPEYRLHVQEGNREVLAMRVVVGKAMNQTPVFSDTMTQVVVNPTWNVPTSIVVTEIAPEMDRDPGYLARHRMRVFDGTGPGARELDPGSVDWWDVSADQKLYVRQDAGGSNALGALKFVLPNSFDIYLHDTPAGHLFSLEDRSFSHGCVRVEDPMRLARYVLKGRSEASPSRLRALIESGETRTLALPRPLPVNIVYFTAFADADGTAGFREDVYGIDADLVEQLRGRARVQAQTRTSARR